MSASTAERKIKRVGVIRVPYQFEMNDYQNWMGGVDQHGQLRLQTYSVQVSARFKKYYKGMLLDLVDMAMVNTCLMHTRLQPLGV